MRVLKNKVTKKRKPNTVAAYYEKEHRHDNPVASFEWAFVNKSIIYVRLHEKSLH